MTTPNVTKEVEEIIDRTFPDYIGVPVEQHALRRDRLRKALTTLLHQERKRIEEKREELADLEHQQWMAWTQHIAGEWEDYLPVELLVKWEKNWKPYSDLTEEEKDKDRKWADKALQTLTQEQ